MKTFAILTLLGLASCSAQQHQYPIFQNKLTSMLQKQLRARMPGVATKMNEGLGATAQHMLSEAADEIAQVAPQLAPVAHVVSDFTAPCTEDDKKASKGLADGLISGFEKSYPHLAPCMKNDACLSSKLAKLIERVMKADKVTEADVLELGAIIYHDVLGEIKSCQLDGEQKLELKQITEIMVESKRSTKYVLKHELINFVLRGDVIMKAFKDAEAAYNAKDYKKCGELLSSVYIQFLIGSPDDLHFPGAKEDVANANQVALENAVVETVPMILEYYTDEAVKELRKEWTFLKYNSKCSKDVNKIRDVIIKFVDDVAKDMKDKEGKINPDWDKIEKEWEHTKDALIEEINDMVVDCMTSSTVTPQNAKMIVKQSLDATSVKTIKPILLQAAHKIPCPHHHGHHDHHHDHDHHHHDHHHDHHHGHDDHHHDHDHHHHDHHHDHHHGHHDHHHGHHPHHDSSSVATTTKTAAARSLQEIMLVDAAKESTQVANQILTPILAKTQASLYMKTFGDYVKAAEGKGSSQLQMSVPDKKCEHDVKLMEVALEEAIEAYFMNGETLDKAFDMVVASISKYAPNVIVSCFIQDPPLAALIVKEAVQSAEEAEAAGAYLWKEVEGEATPVAQSPEKSTVQEVVDWIHGETSSSSGRTRAEDQPTYVSSSTDVAIFASICVGVLILLTVAVVFAVKGCRSRCATKKASTPLLESQTSDMPRRSWLMTAPCHPGSDNTLATEESAARDTPLPEELHAV